jgi:hypothetical protein
MKRLITTLILIITALCFCGCGDDTSEVSNHERPIINLCSSLEHSDKEAYLNCFVPAARKAYLNSGSSSSGSKDIIDTVIKNSGLEENRSLSCDIIGKRELASADREKLERQYKSDYAKNVTFEKAFQIDAGIVSSKGTDIRKFTVVLLDDSWYIYGEVIEKFSF